ncbi:uncharacterized protein LOC117294589 [Asterias rubens]|uniref:uncharacterized protein LOC117294589 n=1 Tax=Asterias rubens TaxID=7604 RepID=UPI0014556D8F|nr:uncharacterized protein LOC117294589 [Asterias rubens]
MSLAEVVEKTALFPPEQQARLRLPRVPGTVLLPSLPVMACGERPVASDVLTSVKTADPVVASRSLTWYRRLHASYNKHRHLEPLRENARLASTIEQQRTSPGSSATGRQLALAKGVSSNNRPRSGKTVPRAPSKEGAANPKKENSDTARRRPKETLSSTGTKHHRSQRMSYPPCSTKPSQTDEWASLPTSEETNSCPVLCDLDNLTITPKKPSSKSSRTQPSTSEQAPTKDTAHHQHKSKSDSTKRHKEHLRAPDSTNTRSRHVKSRRPSREDSKSQRPKPPSWQDIAHDQPTANTSQEPGVTTHMYSVPESVHSVPALRCDSATTRSSTVESDRRAVRANIRRTRSRVIDAKEIPKAETVSLSKTKPSEFNLRKTYQDDTVYLFENTQRCRKWLAAVQEADVTTHFDESGTISDSIQTLEDREEIVTCDMEISHDRWDFLGSPYPESSGSSS